MTRYRHVALLVPNLREAEEWYATLFGMDVLFREGSLDPGDPHSDEWGTLPSGFTWDDAAAADVTIGMVALQRGDFVLPLFVAAPTGTQMYAIGLVMDRSEIDQVRGRLPEDALVESESEGWLAFVDRFGFRWQLTDSGGFRSAGETGGTWLDVSGAGPGAL
jgi:catechol 2,3-dioxygenase-like lactoylglutathione lyase family enzyme